MSDCENPRHQEADYWISDKVWALERLVFFLKTNLQLIMTRWLVMEAILDNGKEHTNESMSLL